MTLTTRDIRVGDCFRWIGPTAPDNKPTYADTHKNSKQPADLPIGWDACDVDDKEKNFKWWADHGDIPLEILEHYRRDDNGVILTRGHIEVGECYEYCGIDATSSRSFLMVEDMTKVRAADLPDGWTYGDVNRTGNNHKRVRRIPRWDFEGTWRGLPRVDELAKPVIVTPLQGMLEEVCDSLTGADCLKRLEYAMQNESLARPMGSEEVVSTLGGYGMNQAQVRLGRRVWAAKLAELQTAARVQDDARKVSVVTCYDPDDDVGSWLGIEAE